MTLKSIISFFLAIFSFLSFSQNDKKVILTDTISETIFNDNKVASIGDSIEYAIVNSNQEKYLSFFSFDKFEKRIRLQNKSKNYNKSYYDGIISGVIKSISTLPKRIISEVENEGYYDFVNYRYNELEKTYFALFRLYTPSGINYHEYRISKNETDGEFKFSDIYIYLSGENFSQTLGRLIQFALNSEENNSKVDKDFTMLEAAINYTRNGKAKEAYNTLNEIKGEISQDKFFMIYKVLIAQQLNDEKYINALKELIETHDDDPTIYLNKIDYYILKSNYNEAFKNIERLKDETQDDFLNLMKANLAVADENYDLADENFKYIIENYPGFFEAKDSYLGLLILQKRNKDAVIFLNELAKEYDKNDLIIYIEEVDENGNNIYEEFMKTEEYKSWKKL